ncbi:hypothetical protein BU17DRAFT_60033 [Hysterangium stoloniferum]|nr:hypothetical protein BU17DRAFT_60033 [Hysterangium stoloniferum]
MDGRSSIVTRLYGDAFIANSTWLVVATVMVYDFGLTIEHETRYLGIFKVIFDISVQMLPTRCKDLKLIPYLHRNDDAAMSNTSCTAFFWWELFSVTAAIVSVQVLAIVLALAVLASLLVMGLHMPVGAAPHLGLTGCFSVNGVPPKFAFGVLLLLIYETILCFLMLWKVIQNYRDGYGSLLLSGMVHDSLIYFVGIFTVLCLDFTLYSLHKQEWAVFIIAREYTIPCAMGCRLLVNTMEWAEVSKSSHDTIATPITFYPIDRLPAHQSEVKITTVTPALDESYRFHTAIGQ